MAMISILLMGDVDRPEFAGTAALLGSVGRVDVFSNVDQAAKALVAADVVPDVIVVAQAYPGRFSHGDIDRLRRSAPLARILGLLGSWCEGETRSGQPWPAVPRIYWHQSNARVKRQLKHLVQGKCPSWGLPVTATEEERLLRNTAEPLPRQDGLIALHARRSVADDWLSAACRTRGYSTVCMRPSNYTRVEGAKAAIFDGTDLNDKEIDCLRRFLDTLGKTPVIVLADFPRIEDKRHAIAAGATTVLAKPLNLDDLYWHLEQM
jgi:hypothetical protein